MRRWASFTGLALSLEIFFAMRNLAVALIFLLAGGSAATAHSFEKDGIAIGHPWSRATAPGANIGVGYLTITNKGSSSDRLTGGSFEGADHVEVHEMTMDGNTMKMRKLSDGLEIKPGETVRLAPSGIHLMMIGLKKPIEQGAMVKGSLNFQKAGTIDVQYKIEALGATSSNDAAGSTIGHDKMDHGQMGHDGMSHDHMQ
jgi:periplasmic copper chaperone A